jgi:hypothetical protein
LAHTGVVVLYPGAGDGDVRGRMVPISLPSGETPKLREQDTILELRKP